MAVGGPTLKSSENTIWFRFTFTPKWESTVKTKLPFWGMLSCFGGEPKMGVVRIGYFSGWGYVQPHHSKGLGESFPLMWLNIGLSQKIREHAAGLLTLTQNVSALTLTR